MRILVLSDSHGDIKSLNSVIERHQDISEIFFLGDLTKDIIAVKEQFKNKNYYIVSGNCDFSSPFPSSQIKTIENTRIFFCHGHRYGVKYTLESIKATARENNCALVLFGHTHCSLTAYDNGLYIVNPGSLSSPRDGKKSYAIIDITKNGIVPSIMKITPD